jgi:biotin-(acetyl-CoA carboxylase) ligase
MTLRESVSDRALDLPPPFGLVTLRERGDAFAHAQAVAAERGAGTLVWVRRFDLAEWAVVLEPDEPLATARRAFFAGMNALADALAAHGPPEKPITYDWPDAIRFDGVLVGGGRLAWPESAQEEDVPDWLVFGVMVRSVALRAGEPGLRPLSGSLEEVGFEDPDAGEMLASFARLLMAGLHDWREEGFAQAARRWLDRMPRGAGTRLILSEHGDLVVFRGSGTEPHERRRLVPALAAPSWLDPATGTPWL